MRESKPANLGGNIASKAYLLVIVVAALYLLSPFFSPQLGSIGHNDQRVLAAIAVASGAALFAVARLFQPFYWQVPRKVERMVWLTVLLGLSSAAAAPFSLRAVLEVFLYVCIFYSGCFVYRFYRDSDCIDVFEVLSHVAVLLVTVYAPVFLFSYATWLLLPDFYCYSCVMPHFDNMRSFNNMQVWLIPLLWYFASEHRSGLRKVLAVIPAVFLCTLLFYTYARGATLAVLVAIVVITMRYRHRSGELWRIAVGTLVLGWALNYFLTIALPLMIGRSLPKDLLGRLASGTSGRTDLWKAAVEMLSQHPWLGVGPQHYGYELFRNYTYLKPFGSPHNMFLTFVTEWGVVAGSFLSVGIVFFVCSVFLGGKRGGGSYRVCYRACKEKQVAEATVISVLVVSLFDGSLLSPLGHIMLVLIAPALLVPNCGFVLAPKVKHLAGHRTYGYALLALCAGIYVIGMTTYDIAINGEKIFKSSGTVYPRYWQNGQFWEY